MSPGFDPGFQGGDPLHPQNRSPWFYQESRLLSQRYRSGNGILRGVHVHQAGHVFLFVSKRRDQSQCLGGKVDDIHTETMYIRAPSSLDSSLQACVSSGLPMGTKVKPAVGFFLSVT